MKFNIKLTIRLVSAIFLSQFINAQNINFVDSVTITPNAEYQSGWFHDFWFGKHWRDNWTTPIRVPVLDLNSFAGGLTPIEKGGGLQTKSLRFKGGNDKIYKFRSIRKDPTSVLDEELKESIIADILQDQISSSNPFGALVVVPLLSAVGVLQAEPYLAVLPVDELLGKYNDEFGGMLGMIEVHPDEGGTYGESFEDAQKIKGTYKLFHRLEEKRDEKIDAVEFLKARLMDNYVGDWDRHTDQWRWAKYDSGENELWKPIPRDRDQAFPKYDGVFPSLAEIFVLQLNHFGDEFPKARNLTWSGRVLDRRYLSELTKENWDSVAAYVQGKLTDEVINDAVDRLPNEIKKLSADELVSKLKSRRDLLLDFSNDYYNLINDVVDIYCSNKDDYVEVSRISNEHTKVEYYRKDKVTGEKKGEVIYQKIFDNKLTSEFRIYTMDGDDKAVINGEVDSSPLVRIIGGKGKDEYIDNSMVHGYLFSLTPIPNAERATMFYDSGSKSVFKRGPGTVIITTKIPEPKNDTEKYEPTYKERSHEIEFNPVYGYSSDDGFRIGGGPTYIVYDYLMNPYEYWSTFTAAYSFGLKGYDLYYKLISKSWISGAETNIEVSFTQIQLARYFGFGNETSFDENLEEQNFNDVSQNYFFVAPSIDFHLFRKNTLKVGITYNAFKTNLNNESLLDDFHNPGYGLGFFKTFEIKTAFIIDTRDVERNSQSGSYINVYGSFFPKLLDNKKSFVRTGFDIRTYISGEFIRKYTLALRASGETVFGSMYPFFYSTFRGGKENLRGYSRERFSGDASFSTQAELRIVLSKFNLYLPGDFGVHFFAETGRVFVDGEISSKWHPSYGGGVWLSLINRILNTSFTVGIAPELTSFYLRARLGF